MIEGLVGLVLGATAGVVLGGVLASSARGEADAENRRLRAALRYVRSRSLDGTANAPHVAPYIERMLDDEAGV